MENTINIEKIMDEIREEVKERELTEKIVPFDQIPMYWEDGAGEVEEFDYDELKNSISYMNGNYWIQPYRILHSRPVVGRIIIAVKKIIRKSVKFYVEPIVSDQNGFNAASTRCMNQLSHYIQEQNSVIRELEERIVELEKDNARLHKEGGGAR